MPIIIENKLIETPVSTLLELLKQQLDANNIPKLQHIEYKQLNARCTCPIHKGGQEHTPSCNVLLEDKPNVNAGRVHCFACGYSANFSKFVADCLDISYRQANEWILNMSSYSFVDDTRKLFEINFNDVPNNNYDELPIVTSEELKNYEGTHPYMYKRHLTDEIIKKFDVGYDKQLKALTFPVYVNGVCLFVAKRRVNFKRFEMPKVYPKPIYGVDYVTDGSVYVVESILNALTLWGWGYQAVALFGTSSYEQIDMLNKLNIRQYILALDNDEGGRNGTKRLVKGLKNAIVYIKKIPADGRDVNDLSKEEFDALDEEIG